jgi:hypothetical protein
MADATRVPELVLFQWAKPDAPNPRLAAPISSTDTTITFTAAPKDKNGNIITGFFNFGIRNNAGYVENVHVPVAGMSVDGLTATGCIRGVGTSGYDYDTSVAGLATDHEQDSPVSCNVTAVLSALIQGALTGDIASTILFYLAAIVPTYADATARNAAITSPVNGMVIQTAGVMQYYGGGIWNDFGTGGSTPNASTTVAGKVELPTATEVFNGTATGGTGAALSVTPDTLQSSTVSTTTSAGVADAGKLVKLDASGQLDSAMLKPPVTTVYSLATQYLLNGSSAQFDITNPSGTTFRYTYDGTGTNPGISSTTVPVGTVLEVYGASFNVANNGRFTVTNSGTNFFEVTNASGVAQNNVATGAGLLAIRSRPYTWTKAAGLRYVVAETLGGGGGTDVVTSNANASGGGGGGGYAKKQIAAATLGATETVTLGCGGIRADSGAPTIPQSSGGTSSFGVHCSATGGGAGDDESAATSDGGAGGIGSSGDINSSGGDGTSGNGFENIAGLGGSSFYGGSVGTSNAGKNGVPYGTGAAGEQSSSGGEGFSGGNGLVIITEYY